VLSVRAIPFISKALAYVTTTASVIASQRRKRFTTELAVEWLALLRNEVVFFLSASKQISQPHPSITFPHDFSMMMIIITWFYSPIG
jgi:hypothetical protein